VHSTADLEKLAYFLTAARPVTAYDFVKETEEINGFDVVFLIGRLVNVRPEQLLTFTGKVRRTGGVLFTLIPMLEADDGIRRALAILEDMRVEKFLHTANVAKISQHSLPSYLAHLHRVLRAAA